MMEFVGDRDPWVATTSGERLLFMLLRHHREYDLLVKALNDARLRLGGRFNDMSNFLVGSSILHLMQRMVKLAKDVIAQREDRLEQVKLLRSRLRA